MNVSIAQGVLLQGINTVQKAMAAKSITPVLEGIHLSQQEDMLKLTCTNNELTIETQLPADIREGGALVLPGRLFAEVIRRLPDQPVELTQQENTRTVTITCGVSRTKLQYLDAEEFPVTPEAPKDNPICIQKDALRKIIRETAFAAATEDTRPILTGVLLEAKENEISMVALDGFRMAVRRGTLEQPANPASAVIPARSLSEIARITDEGEGAVTLYLSPHFLLTDLGATRVTTILLQGEFINYQQVLPADHTTRVQLEVAALMDSIDRAALLAREGRNNLIRMNIQSDQMVITANSEIGDVHEVVPLLLEGAELEIAFNPKFLIDILRAVDGDSMFLDFNTSVSPCLMKPTDGDSFVYLLLPVRVYGG